jgi:hypothetical protein
MAHLQSERPGYRRSVPAGARTCPACGSRRYALGHAPRRTRSPRRSRRFARNVGAERFRAEQEAVMARGR